MNLFTNIIAQALSLSARSVEHTLQLLDEGCTIPFISRYRKEQTGSLDEVQIASISELNDKYKELVKRKETICKTITEQGKITDDLLSRINNCWNGTELEDIYLPYKPKRRTKAQIAREQGLEPLATIILLQREQHPHHAATRFVKGDIKNSIEAIKGAQDIIAETVNEDERSRQQLRSLYRRGAVITSKVVKTKKDIEEAQKFSDYFDWQEPLKRCSSHRLLAMRRGENEGILRVSISADDEECLSRLKRLYIKGFGACQKLVEEAVEDAYKRLLKPAMENEFTALSKEVADQEAIKVFVGNLRQLLLAAPLGQKKVMGVDPGFRTGCKVVCLDAQGNLLYHTVVDILPPKGNQLSASKQFAEVAKKFSCEAIAVGNGTASRETSDIIKHTEFYRSDLPVYVVSEDGASIYSASKVAREEFPNEDVTVRGAVSIARRLMDPLAELVKIDPKNIGVGQYQHDVDQTQLKKSLDQTIESCVNTVGVNLNTASQQLLTYVSGLGPTLASNIVEYRMKNGPFATRAELKKVPRLGPAAFQQCAGFLRIPNSKNPLDNSAVHPESYGIVEAMAKDNRCTVAELIKHKDIQQTIDLNRYITAERGLPTLNDIMKELEKPGRDPRNEIETFEFDERVKDIKDLETGMELPGIVTNITNFGAFVDIGVHQDGLVHISQLSHHFVKDPNEAVHLHQHVRVKVLEVDFQRKRISLTMKF
ncbi:Tex family protein [Prevotella sp. S7 MS 2]|uniref:Tex family protein n=1 Tax=Prevotella sp. S7 MS 2 TaxID=1287488 RepID=UPI000512F433|nr:Tex family protein [Prevotella sp. S7 MS 2]KGI61428.1 RNA-binding protein [Prevotella sp. S7 MS 2]